MYRVKAAAIKVIFLGLFAIIGVFSPIKAQEVSIFLTRHAEKATDDPKNPSLSEKGVERAKQLVAFFENQSIDLFFSTPYKRTIGTIKPLADKNGKEIAEYSPMQQKQFAEELVKLNGKTVLVSGHSNTIPDLVNKLAGTDVYKQIDDSRYGDIWLVHIKDGKAKVYQFYLN